MSDKLNEVLDYILQAAKGIEGQIPDIAEQIVKYGIAWHTVILALGIFIVITSCGVSRWLFKKAVKVNDKEYDFAGYLVVSAGNFLGLLIILPSFKGLLMAWMAPKMYLIEWITERL